MTRSKIINDKYGFDTANETQAICESVTSEKVLEFKKLESFTDEFIALHQNGEIWGVYYDNNEKVVAQDICANIIPNIIF